MIEEVSGKAHLVVKRDGRVEPYSKDKLYNVILWACEGSTHFADTLIHAIDIKIHNKIKIEVLYDEVINTASNLISDLYPKWEVIARNLYLLKLHKDMGVKRAKYPLYQDVIAKNVGANFYDTNVLDKLTPQDIQTLADTINPEYDNLFTFGGLNLFVHKYCNKSKGVLLELPQHTYMRVAIHLMQDSGVEAIIAKYHQLAQHLVTEATPKMVNALRPKAQLFSCCLARMEDSQESIDGTIAYLGRESKYGGGLSTDISAIRAEGAQIDGNKGKSGGTTPFAQEIQAGTGAYNQGSTRSSAIAVYYNWFHYESPEITMLKDEGGKDEERARKMKYAVKWTKQLSDAIRNNEYVYLFDPHKTQDMTYAWGSELQRLYDHYSKSSHVRKRKYLARDLAYTLAKVKIETGNNYTFFTDNANIQNIGAGDVTQSNLCVSGDTLIMTDKGNVPISSVAGQIVMCFNGESYVYCPIFRTDTGQGQQLYKVVLEDGTILRATAYHRWLVDTHSEVRTYELRVGMKVPKINESHERVLVGIASITEDVIEPTYCGFEATRNQLVFNNILTFNCVEYIPNFESIKHVEDELIYSSTQGVIDNRKYTGDIALCNLSSINLVGWVKLTPQEKEELMLNLVTSMDNAIDVATYANNLGKKHSMEHRNLGIGQSNYANLLASNKLLWSSEGARRLTHELYEEMQYYAIKASIELSKLRGRFPLFHKSKWAKGIFPHELSILHNSDSVLNYSLKMDWESLRVDLLKYGIRNEYLMATAPTATSGQCINATPGIDAPRKLKTIEEGTYSLPFIAPNLKDNRDYYQTTFEIDNKDTIELAAIRQKFICMGQSVSLAYATPNSAYEVIRDIMYAEELGLKSLYYTYTPNADDLSEVACENCSS